MEKAFEPKGLKIVRKVFEALDNKSPVFPKEKEIHEQMAARRSAGGSLRSLRSEYASERASVQIQS